MDNVYLVVVLLTQLLQRKHLFQKTFLLIVTLVVCSVVVWYLPLIIIIPKLKKTYPVIHSSCQYSSTHYSSTHYSTHYSSTHYSFTLYFTLCSSIHYFTQYSCTLYSFTHYSSHFHPLIIPLIHTLISPLI